MLIIGTAYNTTTLADTKYALAKQVDSSLWQKYISSNAENATSAENCAMYCRMISFATPSDGLCHLFFYDSVSKKCYVGNRGLSTAGAGPGSGRNDDVYFDPSKAEALSIISKDCSRKPQFNQT